MKSTKLLLAVLVLMSFSAKSEENLITLKYGVDKSGYVTEDWVDFDSNIEVLTKDKVSKNAKKLTVEEIEWASLISSRLSLWETQLEKIAVPYATTEIPRKVSIVVGNRGNRDAFTHTTKFPSKIFFNLSVLVRAYGSGKAVKNQNRIDRIFAHEFTHLLQHAWSKQNPYQLTNHFERALNASFKEGFGHFRSISNKWKDENGHITEHAEKTLKSLEIVFVERMISLINASDDEANVLMKGLSTGPFNKKWGALTVALWLTKEAKGDDKKLIKWVDLGPEGIILLANNHLSRELKVRFNKALNL
ncbi:hypothetical protein [Aliikangiella coralliicola]|uniref:DUF1570 domain-containing protein n=1 Tax=Aliikangiella coralliicola TaxID=2592383 RepID=A0A545TRY9_9GAMM|nr:hypothetical protein [Aliikangiella coralliicola]TQV79997.1 hypothetical protein FLL46_26680 [Aliikangiella coralliicola]